MAGSVKFFYTDVFLLLSVSRIHFLIFSFPNKNFYYHRADVMEGPYPITLYCHSACLLSRSPCADVMNMCLIIFCLTTG